MGISLKPQHLKRYHDVAWLLMKYWRSDLADAVQHGANGSSPASAPGDRATGLAADLERMGPTFVKLGQILSTRPDLVPPAYLTSLMRLQDRVEPFPFTTVERIVTRELGVRLSKAFATFERIPLAAASLGQVHRARLRDGRRVVVKVQRPGIRERVADDVKAIGEIARFLEQHTAAGARWEPKRLVEEFRRSLVRELDYRQEAQNLLTMRTNLVDFRALVVPRPIDDYTTSHVLTMDYVAGTKITSVSPVVLLDVNGPLLADTLFRAYLKQILVDGFVHADPHPGNVFLTRDGRLALIDLGMVASLSPRTQEGLLRLLLAVSEARVDDAARVALELGERTDRFNETDFRRRVAELLGQHRDATLEQIEIGRTVLEVAWVSTEVGIRMPPEFAMLGKTLLNLDQVATTLDPKFNPNAAIRRNAADIMRHRLTGIASAARLYTTALELKDLAERFPGHANRILHRLANEELAVRIDAFDEARLVAGVQKIANRITIGLVLAALIIGAAMLIQVETSFRILGYPGLAIIFFLLAAGGGVALMIDILLSDE
jgi:predicted unusual protein kinase regulating ubiquinone biosynthesis (AarF/ABC1/UbiB family)